MQQALLFSTVFASLIMLATPGESAEDTPIQLTFRENGAFRIVQFADIHWADGGAEDQQTRQLMEQVLDNEKPDLVVFTGDNISGACPEPAKGIAHIVAPCTDRTIPWALVFGNHDDEGPASREEQMTAMRALPLCLSMPGPVDVDGVGNFILPVASSKDGAHHAALLYFFDSLAYMQQDGEKVYNYIQPSQLRWYRTASDEFRAANGGSPLPALAFFHIPLKEYADVWDSGKCIGVQQESVCCSPVNSGLYTAMREQGDVMGISVGHDHVNDYVGDLNGIYLAYGRGTGFNTYGAEGFPRGGRVIELVEGQRRFKTWLRLEGGTVEWQIR